jgi:prepilin-type N-terminal cleavage/methylation domain-containing protein
MLPDPVTEDIRMQQRRASHKGELGFSMIELMVAMVVTLVVSGAIFGLLTVGGNAFRREPEVADRQQNIRVAMDAIARDIQNAGSGMPLVSQVFTHTDTPLAGPNPTGAGAPYLNGQGPQGVLGAAGQASRGAAPTGTGPTPPTTATCWRSWSGKEAARSSTCACPRASTARRPRQCPCARRFRRAAAWSLPRPSARRAWCC